LHESSFSSTVQPGASELPPFRRALDDHFRSIVTDSLASKDRHLTQKKKLLRLCNDWDEFDPCILWSKVQNELRSNPRKRASGLTHAPNQGASSLNQLVHYLRDLCNWLRAAGWSDERLEHSIKRLKLLRVNPRRFEPPTPAQMATLVAQIRKEDEDSADFIIFLMATGCRLAGARDARWSDWSQSRNGSEVFTFREKARKERTVPLTAQASNLLQTIKASGGIKPANDHQKWRDKIFPLGDSRINKAQRLLKKWAEELELPTAFFHSLRHYFASRAIMSGVHEYTVATLIGDSVEMVRKHYGHLRIDHVEAEIQKITI
jgi:integrase